MKKSKIIIAIVAILITSLIVLGQLVSLANNNSIFVGLSAQRMSGIGYGIGNPTNGGNWIWYLKSYNSKNINDISNKQRNLYCIKAEYGDSWNNANLGTNAIVEYNLSYDLIADRETLIAKLDTNSSNDANGVVKQLLNSETGYYRQILWILDNMFVEGETQKTALLQSAGIIQKEDEEGIYYEYKKQQGYDYNSIAGNGVYNYTLTDDDVKAIQQAAIWYYTNKEDSTFDKKDLTDWLTFTTDGTMYTQLADYAKQTTGEGPNRDVQARILYNYLIDAANNNAGNYNSTNGYNPSKPAKVDTTNLIKNTENNTYAAEIKVVGNDYIVGPIKLNKLNEAIYDISLSIKNEENTQITNYTFVNSEGTNLSSQDIKQLSNSSSEIYIKFAKNLAEEIKIDIQISYNETTKTLWLVGEENDTSITLNGEQPVVEVNKQTKTDIVKITAKPNEFDLALRKFIIAINGENLTELQQVARIPNAVETELQANTTASYRHKKDPVVVKQNDIVTYSIRIYNEGNNDGYATQIKDQLPTNLLYVNPTGTITSKDKDGNAKNTYKVDYAPTPNTVIYTIKDEGDTHPTPLKGYTKTSGLDYETLEFNCKVLQEPDDEKQIILTNVAWISGYYDTTKGQIGIDRDSQSDNSPNVTKNNMENYTGKDTYTVEQLNNKDKHYLGEQDDDDFEKLVVMPEEKPVLNFDLALFKYISAISDDETIENGEYITDNTNVDGKYLRAPVAVAIEKGKVKYEENSKDALLVEQGDYVLYTIRVYNEGQVDGYASEIKDQLPLGLEFVAEDEEYNSKWKLQGYDEDGRQIVVTDWYAKGKGAEVASRPGDANYTANLLKALKPDSPVSDDKPLNPDYFDTQILCKVVEKDTSDRVLVNYAQISDDSDSDGNEVEDIDSTPDEWIDGDDDQDIERIKLQYFDLALRKFITGINDEELLDKNKSTSNNKVYLRQPQVDITPLKDKTDKNNTAIYNHTKTPVAVKKGDKITYTLRVYNEGDIDGYASEITDYLPEYLRLAENSEINEKYGWEVDGENQRKIKTTYLKDYVIKAFDGENLKYRDVQIECIVLEGTPAKVNQTNIAEITEYTYNNKVVPNDIDSNSDNVEAKIPDDNELPNYKNDEMNKTYIPGNEDDDDFEKIYVREFDLALRKFITAIDDVDVTTRIPNPKFENGKVTYEHTKEPVLTVVGNVVTYTLRIYNEGEIDGYASVITDDIPTHLEYLPENEINNEYLWKMFDKDGNETEDVKQAVKIQTTYLSIENGEKLKENKNDENPNLLKAFDGTTLQYKDIKVAFKVKDPGSNQIIITNYAQISDDTDSEGNEIKDKDSTTDEWVDGEDDQDVEHVKVQYFDLALLKYVSKAIVIEGDVQKVTETGYNGLENPEPVVKVELHRKKLDKVTVKFGYTIKITNEGDIEGYCTEITDYIPSGLVFNAEDNPGWTDEGNGVISTKLLEGTLLKPGESATVEVILTWVNGADNLGEKVNIAEISADKNDYNVPDIDSTPDNKVDGEDDIDIAKVILSIETGTEVIYYSLILGILGTLFVGIALIKKFVI